MVRSLVLCGSSPVGVGIKFQNSLILLIDNMILQTTIKQKYLGLIFDDHLTCMV